MRDGGKDNFYDVANRAVSEERTSLLEDTGVMILTSEQLPVGDALAHMSIHVKEALKRLTTKLDAISNGPDSHLIVLLERLVL